MIPPVQVIQDQLDAFNRHDMDGFLAHVAEDVALQDADGTVVLRGRAALREMIADMFARHPNLRSDLLDRMALGGWVIDEVLIVGHADDSTAHIISIFQIVNDQISSVRTIRE